MQRLLYIIFISFFLLGSCAKQKPTGVLSESKMIDLLTEVSLIDAYLNTLPVDSGRKVMPVLYDNLFDRFGIDSLQYEDNLKFYYGNPNLTENIYKKIDKNLKKEEEIYRIEDSIRNAFVSDSLRREYKIRSLVDQRINLTLYYNRDSQEPLSYREYANMMFDKLDLGIMAYGIHIPAIQTINHNLIPEEPIMQDSVLNIYLKRPIQEFLFKAPKDTLAIDYRILNVLFLKNSGLNVRTGFTYTPKLSFERFDASTLSSIDSLNQNIVDTTSIESVVTESNEDNVEKPRLRSFDAKSIKKLKPVE